MFNRSNRFIAGALDHLLLQLLHLDALLPWRHAVAGRQTGMAASGGDIKFMIHDDDVVGQVH